ncbi:hypothetical protein Mesau_00920 [Mesorhizobium australicum WSM2073]|jgi:hypothetical protein|uniref:Uncharacterized protein n=2 Tax=Mesorhizobium australicum TaxID=536018 RepID=L0KGA0_MESAW|nr:hypothetical protein Mesau_00920 [Mesorhizobium australicum WSM2073]
MLAATSMDRDESPAPFHVALRILSSERSIPEKLAVYLRDVMTQALQIASDPDTIDGETLPEAIRLALDLRESDALRAAVGMVGAGTISAELAREILSAEHKFAVTR